MRFFGNICDACMKSIDFRYLISKKLFKAMNKYKNTKDYAAYAA